MKPKTWRLIYPDKTESIMNYNPENWKEGYNQAIDEVLNYFNERVKKANIQRKKNKWKSYDDDTHWFSYIEIKQKLEDMKQ